MNLIQSLKNFPLQVMAFIQPNDLSKVAALYAHDEWPRLRFAHRYQSHFATLKWKNFIENNTLQPFVLETLGVNSLDDLGLEFPEIDQEVDEVSLTFTKIKS